MKQFEISYNIGTVKYYVGYHNGVDTNRDGSPFWGCKLFKNKVKMNAFLKELVQDGYTRF